MLSVFSTIIEGSKLPNMTGRFMDGIQNGYSTMGGPKDPPIGGFAKYEKVPGQPKFKIESVMTTAASASSSTGSKLKGIPVMPNV